MAIALDRRLPSAYRWRAAARRDCGWIVGALEDMRMAARMALTPDKHEAALQVRARSSKRSNGEGFKGQGVIHTERGAVLSLWCSGMRA